MQAKRRLPCSGGQFAGVDILNYSISNTGSTETVLPAPAMESEEIEEDSEVTGSLVDVDFGNFVAKGSLESPGILQLGLKQGQEVSEDFTFSVEGTQYVALAILRTGPVTLIRYEPLNLNLV